MPLSKPVSSIMTSSPVVANEFTTFSQVFRLFNEYPVHHLPVVDANNKLIGIISTNDFIKVFKLIFDSSEAINMTPIAIDQKVRLLDIMTPNPVTVTPGETIANALKIFSSGKFLSLPIVENGRLLGILSAKDIIGYIA